MFSEKPKFEGTNGIQDWLNPLMPEAFAVDEQICLTLERVKSI